MGSIHIPICSRRVKGKSPPSPQEAYVHLHVIQLRVVKCFQLTAPMFEREKVPPLRSEGGSCPLEPRSCKRFSSTVISNTDLFCRGRKKKYPCSKLGQDGSGRMQNLTSHN